MAITGVATALGLLLPATARSGHKPGVEFLQTPDGVRFGLLGAKPSQPVPLLFVFAGSVEGTLGSEAYAECGRILGKQGFLCVSLDLPCHGKDQKEKDLAGLDGWRARLQKGEKLTTEFTVRCSSVLDHLIKQGYADPERVFACGTSRGGFMAMHFAAAEPRIKAVAAFAPVTNLLALREFAGMKDHAETKALSIANLGEKLAGRPVWVCIGNRDDRVSTDEVISCTRQLVAAAAARGKPSPVELHVLPAAGHSIHPTAHKEAAAWFLATLPVRKP